MWLCVMFCGLPKLNFLMCLMHFFWVWEKKRVRKFDNFEFFFEKLGFEDHLKLWTFMPYHKNSFSNDSVENFSRIFQNFCFFEIQPIKPIFWPIKMWRRKMAFSFKSFKFLQFLPNYFRSVEPVFMCISILAQFLLTDRISNFFRKRESNLTFSKEHFVYLFDSFLNSFPQFFIFFFVVIVVKDSKVFFIHLR